MSKVRKASHADSWYTKNAQDLDRQLTTWLKQAPMTHSPARAIIAPHAGYAYCGSCSAHAYKQVDVQNVRRVFILGPSHYVRLSGCALSSTCKLQTPLGDLNVDTAMYAELESSNLFETISLDKDEEEHSLEMHLPYVAKLMQKSPHKFTIVPVLVGSLSTDKEQQYGKLFSKYLADPDNLFVISSDFCHWGDRFKYTYYDNNCGDIWQSIQNLDKMGMDAIETMNPAQFTSYLKKYQNTICGRHPISVLLHAISTLRQHGNGHQYSLKFIQYAQSSQCKNQNDSSVSYAAATFCIM